ncbi:hypothetical protein DFS33DRAFT_1049498 [Desarmillaria ectypa]|nr:hypothetical protein DFS33DRAFT_1049498 [Desarmillaria ectypa]
MEMPHQRLDVFDSPIQPLRNLFCHPESSFSNTPAGPSVPECSTSLLDSSPASSIFFKGEGALTVMHPSPIMCPAKLSFHSHYHRRRRRLSQRSELSELISCKSLLPVIARKHTSRRSHMVAMTKRSCTNSSRCWKMMKMGMMMKRRRRQVCSFCIQCPI